jgi:hypothetical protein
LSCDFVVPALVVVVLVSVVGPVVPEVATGVVPDMVAVVAPVAQAPEIRVSPVSSTASKRTGTGLNPRMCNLPELFSLLFECCVFISKTSLVL